MSRWTIRRREGIAFAEAGGVGPVMVLCHGGAGSHTHWVRNIDALAGRFRVRALDLPGYGASDAVDKSLSADDYVAAVTPMIDRLNADVEHFHLVGFSFGGVLSAGVAAALGTRVARLSLIAPGGFGNPRTRALDMRRLPEGGLEVPEVRAVVRHNLLEMMLADPVSIGEETLALQLANSRRTGFNSSKLSLSGRTPRDVPKIAAALQVVWGDADRLAHPSPAERGAILQAARPGLPVHLVPGGGHWVQYERAEAVNRLLLDFHAP